MKAIITFKQRVSREKDGKVTGFLGKDYMVIVLIAVYFHPPEIFVLNWTVLLFNYTSTLARSNYDVWCIYLYVSGYSFKI